jgi:NodT family efflux transporter outer membrane factor (OMF) lipoprotein
VNEMTAKFWTIVCGVVLIALSACTVGPDYKRPGSVTSVTYKEAKNLEQTSKNIQTDWWELFNDPYLNKLESQVNIGNQSLAEAQSQFEQAQALVQEARSQYFPVVMGNTSVNRFRAASGQSVAVQGVKNLFGMVLSASWEPDLWGAIRRQVEASEANAQASFATLQAMRLSTHATLAQSYFQIRGLDAQKRILDETIVAYEKILKINKNRYNAGVVSRSDIVQAEAQLELAKSQQINLGILRAKLEHAIALLMGKVPSEVSIPFEPLTTKVPEIPVALPSELVKRRPDISVAERKVAAANAQIGVATAAYFPTLSLSSQIGRQSRDLSTLMSTAARYWALGPAALALPLFDGGARGSQLESSIKAFDAAAAAYRQSVLVGFGEVEDNLAALRILEQQIEVQNKAQKAAREAVVLSINQYKAGFIDFLNVQVNESVALQSEKNSVDLQAQRLDAAVLLIKALGGGWSTSDLPKQNEVGGKIRWSQFLPIPVH